MSSIQGSNSLWNIDFSNPDSVATINNKVEQEPIETDFSGRGLGFMSFVYASMDNTDDGTYVPNSGYIVENADFLQKYTEDDMKNYLESNSSIFNTTIDWTEYEDVLSSGQIAQLSAQYSGSLTLSGFTEAMEAIEALKELNDVTGEYVATEVNSYQLFAGSMATALDSYITSSYEISNDMSSEVLDFLSTDYNSTDIFGYGETLSFADHFENMIDDLMMNTNMDISGLLSVLDGLRASELSFDMSSILSELNNDTIANLYNFASTIG